MKSEVSLVKTKTRISYYCYNDLLGFYLKNSFNPNQGIKYNSMQLYLVCKRKFFG